MSRISRALLALMVVLLAAGNVWAQATAQINGTVADSSGAVLPGVTVIAIQTQTGFRREAVTDETGSYALLNLPTGPIASKPRWRGSAPSRKRASSSRSAAIRSSP